VSSWLNHQVVTRNSGAAAGAVYTWSTAATAGSLLVLVGAGQVSWTDPAGYTQRLKQLSSGGLYVWSKTAAGGETSVTITHNGSGGAAFPTVLEVFEFPAGSTWLGGLGADGASATGWTGPVPTGLTGTYTAIRAVGEGLATAASQNLTISVGTALAGANGTSVQGTSDGITYAATYVDGASGSTMAAWSGSTSSGGGPAELVAFAIVPATAGTTKVTKTLATSWAVRSRITKTLSTVWAVRSNVQKTLSTAWAVRTSAGKTLATSWAVRSRIVKTIATVWAVRSRVSKTSSTAWAVRTGVAKTLATSWAVRVQVTKTLATAWNLASSTTNVVKTLATSWSVRSRISKTLASSWAVRVRVTKTAATVWAVRARVTGTLQTGWADRSSVTTNLGTSWAVRRQIAKSIATTWAVRQRVVKVTTTTWDVASNTIPTIARFELTDGRVVTIEGIWNGVTVDPVTTSVYLG
jgi:hypothetical protein